nr:ribosome maturation factor RimP [Desulfobacterales bacterium]
MNFRAQQIIREVEAFVEPLLQAEGMELVDVEYRREGRGWTLRIYIDKDGGVTLDDCVAVTRQLEYILDVKLDIEEPYLLEVSSPGLDRKLKKEKDFTRFRGRKAIVHTDSPVEGRRYFKGIIGGYAKGMVTLIVDGRPIAIPHKIIKKAHLDYVSDLDI